MGNTGLRRKALKRVCRLILCHPISFVLALGIAIGVPVLAWIPWGCPSDQRIRDQFSKHATEFSELKEMILRDKVSCVSHDHVGDYWLHSGKWHLENATLEQRQRVFEEVGLTVENATFEEGRVLEDVGLTAERYHHYLDLLTKTGAMDVGMWDGGVRFAVYAEGFAVSGILKSITYCEEPPFPLVDDTDAAMKAKPSGEAYAPIYGKWYISNSWE
jgi:hypothetical protein